MTFCKKYLSPVLPLCALLLICLSESRAQTCEARFGFTVSNLTVAFHDSSSGNALSYLWNFGDGTPPSQVRNPVHTYQFPGEYFVTLRVANPNINCADTLIKRLCLRCVFPGDANDDGIVNNIDVLYVGLAFGSIGPVRNDTSTSPSPVASVPWVAATGVANLPSGINIQHADCDGNGIINRHDVQVISKNYGQVSGKGAGAGCANPNDVPLYFEIIDSIPAGSAVQVAVKLGTLQIPANDVYGIAFTLNYDNLLVKPGTMTLDYSASLFGRQADIISLSKDFPISGKIESAVSRIDHNTLSMSGIITTAGFVMEENLAQKDFITQILKLAFSDVLLIRNDESVVPVCAHSDSAVVFQKALTSGNGNMPSEKQTFIYPNPTSGMLNIQFKKSGNRDVLLLNMLGKTMLRKSCTDERALFDATGFPNGIYFLVVRDAETMQMFKIEIAR